jgi:hypothetical protein
MNKIKDFEVIEGNIKAVKDTGDFGGPNMWNLHVKNTDGWWQSVQWMGAYNIQRFFKTKLPIYKETEISKYELQ